MELTADELAGVVDVFGAVTRSELEDALGELGFKRGADVADPEGSIDDAVASYHLVEFETDDDASDDTERLLVPGPTAFPRIPEGAEDLPHIVDVPDRDVDRDALAAAVAERFREESVVAVRSGNEAFVDRLLDVSYELEVWGSVDVAGPRTRLAETRDAG